jgi:exopolysaccharide biosynthesis polyprenyl glycosylphosphotransferase
LKYPLHKLVLVFVDWLGINAAFVLALLFRSHLTPLPSSRSFDFSQPAVLFFVVISLGILVIFQHEHLYEANVFLTAANQTARIVKSVLYTIFGFALLSFLTRSPLIINSRLVLLFFAAASICVLFLLRVVLFRSAFLYATRSRIYRRRLLIVGAGEAGLLLAANITWENPFGLDLVGFLDNEKPVGSNAFEGFKILGRFDEVESSVERYRIDEIVVSAENVSHEELISILASCKATGATVKISSPLYGVIPERLFTEKYGEISVIGISRGMAAPIRDAYKRIFDSVFSVFALILLTPVFLILGILIKIDSRGPVFFRQIRIGKNGKPFVFYKFRSMYVGSEDDETRKHVASEFIRNRNGNGNGSTKILDESKVTRVGRFLRKTSLDELPQLVNVVRGEMSMVGPRPCLPYEWESYENWHRRRLAVTPGCTGVWQVSGRSAVSFEDMVILDFYYIQNVSPLFDLQLILKTIPVMILGKGAK